MSSAESSQLDTLVRFSRRQLWWLLAFMFVLGRTFLARTFTHEQAVTAVVVSYYWHFVDVVWIALFGVIYLLR